LSFFHAGPAPKGAGPRSGGLRDGLILTPGMKVGLFGGSFNPAHDGHAHVAETAMRRLGLDRVVWLVSPQNPPQRAPLRTHGFGA
jgi:nicotinate-nucleotide adenylyltransferase